MRGSVLVVVVVIAAGALAGLVYGAVNAILVNPYLETAIEMENQAMFAAGLATDTAEFRAEYDSYREWQRGGQLLASAVLGAAFGSLFGVVFLFSERMLPGGSHMTKALALAGIMWCAMYMVPFIKYPANPPAVGDPETILIRTLLYVALVAASGLGALGAAKIYSHLAHGFGSRRAVCVAVTCYVSLVLVLYASLPSNPDPAPAIDQSLLDGFRAASAVGVTAFWISLGAIFGMFWHVGSPKVMGRLRKGSTFDSTD